MTVGKSVGLQLVRLVAAVYEARDAAICLSENGVGDDVRPTLYCVFCLSRCDITSTVQHTEDCPTVLATQLMQLAGGAFLDASQKRAEVDKP